MDGGGEHRRLAGAQLAKKVIGNAWTRKRGAVPGNPATDDTSWGEAVAWAVVSGVGVGVARLLAQRGVALAFEKKRGSIPTAAAEQPTA